MKKIFTLLLSLLTISTFAATEQAWYNDVTSIANNGQYYIYSVNGKGFMQGGNSKVKAVTQNNYNSESNLLFTISTSNKRTYSGSNYLCSYETQTCGPVGGTNTNGSTMIWEGKSGYWLVYGSYSFIWTQKAYLRYENNAYNATCLNPDLSDSKFHWYLVSPAQYDRHWAIYLYDRYKESISDYTKWENLVPAAYYTALADAYAVTYNVQNAAHSKEIVVAHRAELTNLYNNAEEVAAAYAAAKGAIEALEAVEDKGEDFAEVTTDINNARTALEASMTVEAIEASVAGLKAIDPITFNVTEFEVPNFVTNAASSAAGRTISYDAADKSIINADGKAIYAGTTTLTATAAATNDYYKFVRSAQVTVTAWDTEGEFEQTTCDEAVEFNNQTYEESFAGDVNVGKNYIGGDSIVHVNIVINHASSSEDELAIIVGTDTTWNGIALKDSTVGVHSVVYVTTNAVGCDSTVTLTLTVNKLETLNVPVELSFCEGGSEWYRGTEYTEAGAFDVPVEGATRDTLYQVHVTILQPTFGAEEKTITFGDAEEWNGINLSDSTVGQHIVTFVTTNEASCDSTVTLTLTVNKLETLNVPVELSFCEGGSEWYRGTEYTEAGVYDVPAEGATRDTLYKVNVTVLQPSFGTEEMAITVGDDVEWNGVALKDSTVGVHYVEFVTTNVAGCDSTVTLTLTVNKMDTLKVDTAFAFCEGGSEEFHGKTYTEAIKDTILAIGETRDTLYFVNVTVLQPSFVEEDMTIIVGTDTAWNGIALKDSTVGVHYVEFVTTNVAGCDSTVTLTLTVNKMDTLEVYYPIGFCTGDSAEYRGKWYYEYALDTIYAEGDVRDTIIYVEAMLLPTTDLLVLYDTIVSGNEVILPEGEWVIGEDTVSGTYPTVESEDVSELIFHQYFDEPVVCGPNYIELVVTVTPKEQKPGDTTTDIEDVLDAQKAEKVLIDGVLYIRRGEKVYTASGELVK